MALNTLSYRHFDTFCTVRTAVFAVLFGIFSLFPALAHADAYTVENIEVDVTADNAVQAREKAFEEAQVKGYKMLAEKMLSPEAFDALPEPDINTVANLVQDYEVTNEKLSAVRYKGVYKISYSQHAFNTPAADNLDSQERRLPRGDILLLPFYEAGGQTFLWQGNPLKQALYRQAASSPKIILPRGDRDDLSQIQNHQALNYDPSRLNAMRLRYQAKEAVIAIASEEPQSQGAKIIRVSLYNTKPYGPDLLQQFPVQSFPGELKQQHYNRVAAEISKRLSAMVPDAPSTLTTQNPTSQSPTTQNQAPLNGPTEKITVQLSFASIREWVETKKTLDLAQGIQSINVQSLSPRNVTMVIEFKGGVDRLRNTLRQSGMGLNSPRTAYGGAVQSPIYQLYRSRTGDY